MDIKIEIKEEILPPNSQEINHNDSKESFKETWNELQYNDDPYDGNVLEIEYKNDSKKDLAFDSRNLKSENKNQFIECKTEIDISNCKIKMEQLGDGECSYADREAEQISGKYTESLLSKSFPVIIPSDQSQILAPCNIKQEILDLKPVAVIILNKVEFHKRNFVCKVCFELFESIELLKIHKSIHKKIDSNIQAIRKMFDKNNQLKCDQCNFECLRPSHLKRHYRTIHNGGKPYKCNICDYKSARAWNLKTHLMTHTGEKPYTCDLCDYKTARLSDYNIHKMNHNGQKAFKCDVCDYKTMRPSDLKGHKMTHSGEKPYQCDICNFKFVRPWHLKSHKMTHTGEKPFKCNHCLYQSARWGDLKRHQTLHMRMTVP